eukprot:TRINITY_DN24395_c0_g1_i1.p2 TRINITY_DN24395_c0_g1~~TRINITY_DN24395_c0_g1_i1.p2  ORF type:complete len:101 (-),score=8.44 TRINITY_DN24395_c0_g1_i1:276-578(-)
MTAQKKFEGKVRCVTNFAMYFIKLTKAGITLILYSSSNLSEGSLIRKEFASSSFSLFTLNFTAVSWYSSHSPSTLMKKSSGNFISVDNSSNKPKYRGIQA